MINTHTRRDIAAALGEIQVALVREAIHIDMYNAQQKASMITPAKGGIINAARNRLFKK